MNGDPDGRLERQSIDSALAEFVPRRVAIEDRRAAAVAVTIGGPVGQRRMLLTMRPVQLRAHPGQFALPGGRIDPGETAEEACLRELEEELGVAAEPSSILGRLDDFLTRSGYVITPFVVWIGDSLGDVVPSPDEVATVYEVHAHELDTDPRFVSIAQSDRPVVQWPFRGSLVHAPTGAIVHQFREVVLHRRHTRVAHFEQPVFAWQ
ncbi:CoA pyrophosphatase [Rhodococcus sp. BGS-1C]|jgi:8-oxo-dGTP pyrophosphatase MutT (NUDIX family)|uniref:NUDIX hydrolase n=1 Tax=Nocardiaceae TaxID=85025 RepID=UPI00095BA732|nr:MULTISPECIES: CoA pyrophosphatase [Rhodococcus]MCC8930252.1 CoA pyrophosphatase [Rhodococcus sp. I2R]MCZ4275426.1 CoA pyrophosphatase [Rhodococcus yunnanensis]OLT36923.1 coenzyme A pyrophosphatase [Rhodococcus sp. CUA-806]